MHYPHFIDKILRLERVCHTAQEATQRGFSPSPFSPPLLPTYSKAVGLPLGKPQGAGKLKPKSYHCEGHRVGECQAGKPVQWDSPGLHTQESGRGRVGLSSNTPCWALPPFSSFIHTLFYLCSLTPIKRSSAPFFGQETLQWRQSLTFYNQRGKVGKCKYLNSWLRKGCGREPFPRIVSDLFFLSVNLPLEKA